MQPDGAMLVEGQPFMPIGAWCHEEAKLADLKAWGMNTAWVILSREDPVARSKVFAEHLAESQTLGLKVIGYFMYGGYRTNEVTAGWTEAEMRPYLAHKDNPALIGWALGDDLRAEQNLGGVKQAAEIVRRIDPAHPTIGDTANLTVDAMAFKPYLDVQLPYRYPITYADPEWYEAFLARSRRYLGSPIWTFVQAFDQRNARETFGVGHSTADSTPDPGQMRLVTYLPVALGYKGLMYFGAHTIENDPIRVAQFSILNAELAEIGPLALTMRPSDAADALSDRLAWPWKAVKTFCLEDATRKLVFVFSWRHDDYLTLRSTGYESFPVRIWLQEQWDATPTASPAVEAYQVGFPGLERMKLTAVDKSTVDLHVPRLEVMGVYLVTRAGDPIVKSLRDAFSGKLPAVAVHRTALAELQVKKVGQLHRKLATAGVTLSEADEALAAAEAAVGKARAESDPEAAYRLASEALVQCRAVQTAWMKHAWRTAARFGVQFYALPAFFEKLNKE